MSRVTKAMKINRTMKYARRRRWDRGMMKSYRLQRRHRCKTGHCLWVPKKDRRGWTRRSPGQDGGDHG